MFWLFSSQGYLPHFKRNFIFLVPTKREQEAIEIPSPTPMFKGEVLWAITQCDSQSISTISAMFGVHDQPYQVPVKGCVNISGFGSVREAFRARGHDALAGWTVAHGKS